jgi:Leucine-rich repeat (LRR) protein
MNPIVYELTQLRILHMQYSGLKGEIPAGLSKLQNLHALNLYGNQLTGTIPNEIGQMPKLWHIDFSENDFTGHLPAEAISMLTDLEKFHVSQSGRTKNGISGKLPSFKNNVKLHMLDLSSNSITGSIPSDFLSGVDDVAQNMQVRIGYNSITGTVPGSLSRFSNMTFHAVKTELSSMDASLCSLTGWMNGEVGNVIDQGGNGCDAILCPKGTYNNFGRAISGANGECKSCSDGKYMGQTSCTGVSSSDNLEKTILDKLFTETAGTEWEAGENWANGKAVCSYEGITCNQNGTNINEGVIENDMSGFGLTGNIPTDIYKLPHLRSVDFSNNVVDLSFVGIEQSSTLESITIADADLTSVLGIGNAPASLKKVSSYILN